MNPVPVSRRAAHLEWLLAFGLGITSLFPLWQNLAAFRTLFYFQDEWDLIDTWERVGTSAWLATVFSENFVPLFKGLWGGAIIAGGGSYFTLLLLLWATHALNTFLLVRICQRFQAGFAGAALTGLVFGLAWLNYETLAWTVQWSAVLSLAFLLLGVDLIARAESATESSPWKLGGALALCALASALCFSRGVLTGGAFAVWALLTPIWGRRWRVRAGVTLLMLLPAAVVAWWIFRHSEGNHRHVGQAGGQMLVFALYYYAQAPLRTLWSDETPGLAVIVMLAGLKSAIMTGALIIAPRRARAPLAALWAFELANALLLGLGRYHTGLPASGSSRYQYGALATLLPAITVLFDRGLQYLPRRWAVRPLVASVALGWLAWKAEWRWPSVMADWVPGHGREIRRILFQVTPAERPDHFALHSIPNDRAALLAAKFRMH